MRQKTRVNSSELRLNLFSRRWAMIPLGAALLIGLALPTAGVSAEGKRIVLASAVMPNGNNPEDPDLITAPRGPGHAPSNGWTDSHCGQCHQTNDLFSHPVDVIPSMQVPDSMPLQNGRIACTTCHDDRSEAHAAARLARAPMLRESSLNGNSFCTRCHDPMLPTRKSQHGAMLGRAHLSWPGQRAERAVRTSSLQIDAESQSCLSCHDGLMSTDIAISRSRDSHDLSEHPIGVSVKSQRTDLSGPVIELRSPSTLDGRIRLFDNKVGCTTCHSPFSREPRLLVMSNTRSRLCLSCHLQ